MLTTTDTPAPDGAGAGDSTPVAGQPPPDMIARVEAQRAFADRDAAKAEARAARERVEQLERDLAAARQPPAAPPPAPPTTGKPDPDAPPAWAKDLIDQNAALKREVAELADARKAEAGAARVRALVDQVSAAVPDQRLHSLVAPMISGLIAEGKATADADPAALLVTLRTTHPSLFASAPGSPRSAVQTGPDGRVTDWSTVRSLDDLTPQQIKDMPDEQVDRIVSGNTSGGGALLIAGKRR
jgi:hypothetical protein